MNAIDPRLRACLVNLARQDKRETFDVSKLCFQEQQAFLQAPGKRKVLRCSRRAGKTSAIAPGLLEAVIKPPFTNVFYLAPTFKRAKRIIWSQLKDINRRFTLGGIPNETEGSIKFPALGPDVHVYLGGLKDKGEADKVRGITGKLWAIDEAADPREEVLSYALREAIEPGLLDYDGSLWIAGTPGPVRAGYFFDIDVGTRQHTWEHHHWTWRENVMLPRRRLGATAADIEQALLREFGLSTQDASWLREWCGQWVEDLNALVCPFPDANYCEWQDGPLPGWTYVLCFDIGSVDADAVGVIGWKRNSRKVHLVYERCKSGEDVTDLAEELQTQVKRWSPIRIVGDLGALGKKIGDEMRRRFALPVEAADKLRKLEHIAILNAAVRRCEFVAPKDSTFVHDTKKLQWDMDKRAKNEQVISPRFHSDAFDMVLYGFMRAQAYLEQPTPTLPTREEVENKWVEEQERLILANDSEDYYGQSDARELGYE